MSIFTEPYEKEIWELQQEVKRLTAALDAKDAERNAGPRTVAVTDDLFTVYPVTADGVKIEPGMILYDRNLCVFHIGTVWVDPNRTHQLSMNVATTENGTHLIRWWNCYSTRAAAESSKGVSRE